MAGAAIKGITIEIGANTTKLSSALNQANKAINTTQSELRRVEKALKFEPGNTALLADKMAMLGEKADAARGKVEMLKDVQKDMDANGVDKNSREYIELQREIDLAEQELRQLEEETKRFGSVGAQQIAAAGKKIEAIGDGMTNAGKKMMPVTAGIVALGGASVAAASNFEDAMAKVSTIADTSEKTGVPIDKLREQIMELSNATGIAAPEIAENVYNAISAGQKTGDAVNFVAEATKLAKAGFAESGAALDVLTTVMNAYGMSAEDVTRVSDVLIKTQNLGKTTVGELSATMGKIIPTANASNVALEQVAAGYAIMTSNGIATAESTTYMNSMLNELSKSGTKASTVIKDQTGKSFQELIADGASLSDVLAILSSAATEGGLTLSDMFGSAEAGKAALVLLGDGAGEFNDVLASMNKSAGMTDEAFGKMNTSSLKAQKALNRLNNSSTILGSTIMEMLEPFITRLSETIERLTERFNNMDEKQRQTIVTIGLVVASIGPLLIIFGQLGHAIGGIMQLAPMITGAMTQLGSALGIASESAGGLSAVLTVLTGPIGIVIAAIGAITAAVITLWNTNEGFRTKILEIWNGLVETFSQCREKILSSLNSLGFDFESIGEVIKTVWQTLCDFFAPVFEGSFQMIVATLEGFMQVITGIIEFWTGVISGNWQQAWQGLVDMAIGIFNTITAPLQGILTTIGSFFGITLSDIKNTVSNALEMVKIFFQTKLEAARAIVNAALTAIKLIFTTVLSTVKTVVSTALEAVKNFFSEKLGAARDTATSLLEAIKSTFVSVFDGIKSHVSGVVEWLKGIFNFEWKLPDIKLPHFSLEGEFDLQKGTVPHLSVEWYDKGGIFSRPTVIGVGEKRPEFVGALDDLRAIVREESGGGPLMGEMVRLMQILVEQGGAGRPIEVNQKIYADSTSYVEQQRQAAREFGAIARSLT